ncbi:MAG TPA: redoxin domain-containing protein [Solirubrobacteraceae bacterium]
MTRAPANTIPAPPFLTHLRWVNVKSLRMERQIGKPVLIEFWDFCRPNSMRTLPYMKAWHERYAADGLQVIGIHSPGFEPARERSAAKRAVERLEITYPVLLDPDLEMWQVYENQGWPARYLFDGRGSLFDYHYGEGAYTETELAIQELLGVERKPLQPLRPEDEPTAQLVAQTEDQAGAYSGPYEAGCVWAVLEGEGVVRANDTELAVTHAGAYQLIEHERHTTGVLDLQIGAGVVCHATCFTPGVAAADA